MYTCKEEDLNKMSKEDALKKLKQTVDIRDSMCGDLYWNVLNDECCQIANKCRTLGIDRDEIASLLGTGNYR